MGYAKLKPQGSIPPLNDYAIALMKAAARHGI